MSKIEILDCTLRDGGYCNQWNFGYENSLKVVSRLVEANIDIIECGFITNRVHYNPDITKFETVNQISSILPADRENKLFVAMMNLGEFDPNTLPEYDGNSVDGIRVAFHKKNAIEAIEVCKIIKNKGYKVFVQGMVSLSYSDEEFLTLINQVNNLEPYAFYIVDSFGEMKKEELIRLFYLVEHNLKMTIKVGFHSHNNLQLAYSNAQCLADVHSNHQMIIDSSIYGMGRGAGNLNTELFVQYLNENNGVRYNLKPLLSVIDEILDFFYQNNRWGYSLPNYLSASHHAHPNYAGYLDDKKTLTVENMATIFDMMDEDKKIVYDKEYIEKLYVHFMETGKTHEEHRAELEKFLYGKRVLLIAAGKSSEEEKNKIIEFSQSEDVVSISVNYEYKHVTPDYIFLSNLRRYRELNSTHLNRCIVTSNIPAEGVYLQTNYCDLVDENETIKDNASMMAIKFLAGFKIKKIYLAGLDGYSHDPLNDFAEKSMSVAMKRAVLDATNESMQNILNRYKNIIEIEFLTKPRHVVL